MKSRTPWKAAPKPRRSRAVKGSDLMTYNLVKVPRKLLEDARAKCEREIPRLTLTSQIVKLLMEWLEKDRMMGQVIHHKDADPTNNDLKNLELRPAPKLPEKARRTPQEPPAATNSPTPDLF